MYRQVLRQFSHFAFAARPAHVRDYMIRSYLYGLRRRGCSASWMSANISVLRTILDKIGGMGVCTSFVTPKRPQRLPEILSPQEVGAMVSALPAMRDRLILGLLYGCGLRVGELCRLTWRDLNLAAGHAYVRSASLRSRHVTLPAALLGILTRGVAACDSDSFIFPGARQGAHLSERMVERIVTCAARAAEIGKPVCCMTLRHAYAIQRLRDGASVRDVQESLGHRRLRTTMQYFRCLLPEGLPETPAGPAAETISLPDAAAYTLPRPEELPFGGTDEPAPRFRELLRTHLAGRFLALRTFMSPQRRAP